MTVKAYWGHQLVIEVIIDCTILTVVDAAESATNFTELDWYIVALIDVRGKTNMVIGVWEVAVERE